MDRRNFILKSVAGVTLASRLEDVRQSNPSSIRETAEAARLTERYTGLIRPLRLDLSGDWYFREDPQEAGESSGWFKPGAVRGRVGRVPLPWQLAFEELRNYSGTVWYERSFRLSAEFLQKRIALVFEAVDHEAKVWVNGQLAGGHAGGQTPFVLDITALVKPGRENVLSVKVTDPAEGMSYFMDTHSLINISGIWRNVWIEGTGQSYVSDAFVLPDIETSMAEHRVCITLGPQAKETQGRLRILIKAPDGTPSGTEAPFTFSKSSTKSQIDLEVPVKMDKAILWELDKPSLYQAEYHVLNANGLTLDYVSLDFGMRKIEARGDRILLNHKPVYIVGGGFDPGPYGGAVDINWHLPPPYVLPTDEQIQEDIRTAKSLGINFARVPLRPADPRFLYWADRLGLLVMQGGPWTPTEGIAGKEGFEIYREWWSEIVFRDRNHPSLVLWELFNEGFGMTWEKFKSVAGELYDHVKRLDPTRFVLDNAGGWALNELNYINNHGKTDVHDVHSYPSFPVAFDGETVEMRYPPNTRELFLGIRSQGKPALVTEFGPAPYMFNVDKVKQKWGGKDPWWFHARPKRTAMPAQWNHVGFEERFYRWGFDELYGSFTRFIEASDWYHFDALKYQTELMRMNPELTGFVCWLFDSAPHAVGSIDFYKDKKVYCDELAKIWTQDLVMIDSPRQNFWVGETLRADLHVSHFSPGQIREGRIEWWLEGFESKGIVEAGALSPGEVNLVGRISFRLPEVTSACSVRLFARLRNGSDMLSENHIALQIYPLSDRQPRVSRVNFLEFYSSNTFQVLGYDVPVPTKRPGRPSIGFDPNVPIAVASNLENPALVKYLKDGATVLLLICEDPNYWGRRQAPRVPSIARQLEQNGFTLGGRFQGGHSDSFFVRKSIPGLFSRIPFRNPISWPFYKVWPRNSIVGWKPDERGDLLAGAHGNLISSVPTDTSGKQRPSEVNATLGQFRFGKGRLIVSTFELVAPCLDDPVAAIMLNDLVWYATTDFQPKREWIID